MFHGMKKWFTSCLAAFLFFVCAPATAATPVVTVTQNASSVGRYDMYELTLTNAAIYANPWEDVLISAVFTAPSAKTYSVGGFYYDVNTWKLRFAPIPGAARAFHPTLATRG